MTLVGQRFGLSLKFASHTGWRGSEMDFLLAALSWFHQVSAGKRSIEGCCCLDH
jgi:hypothetical protein